MFKRKVKDDLLVDESNGKEKKPLNKKIIIPVGVVALLLVVVIIVKAVSGNKDNGLNYYDTLTSVFTNELGTFRYVLNVQTSEKGRLITANTVVEAAEATNESETATSEEATEQASASTSKNEFQDWDKYDSVRTTDWRYPSYNLVIEGGTMSLEPLETAFTITLSTPYTDGLLTEVIVKDGKYYIDLETMYNWFANSGDSYLMDLGKGLPYGSKWLVLTEEEFRVASRLAEDGDEKALSESVGLVNLYRRFLVHLLTFKTSMVNKLGDTGITMSETGTSLNLTGSDAEIVVNGIKTIANQSGDFYNSIINTAIKQNLYDETQQKQAWREKDNYIEAFHNLMMYLNLINPSDVGLQVSGTCRQYTNAHGNTSVDASLSFAYSTDNADHIVQFTGSRSGDKKTIEAPSGTQTSDNSDVVHGVLDSACDYFNTTLLATSVQLNVNPTTLSNDILDKFISLVNETGTAGYYVTRHNVHKFIEDNSFASVEATGATAMNAQLVVDLADALDRIIGGNLVEKEIAVSEEVIQYPDVKYTVNGVDLEIQYDAELSDARVLVLNMDAINKTEEVATIDLSEFSVRTLLSSIYPANNETLMRNYDNTFDMSLLIKEVELQPHQWGNYKMYFVVSDDGGHMDIFFGDTKIDTVIQY